jgi:hypothetical protein
VAAQRPDEGSRRTSHATRKTLALALFRKRAIGFTHFSTAAGHIGPSRSSRYAAAPLRFARFAVTAPFRCGVFVSMVVAAQAGPQGRLRPATTMETTSLSRAEGSMFATPGFNPGGATREAGLTLTPSTDQAQRTEKISKSDV